MKQNKKDVMIEIFGLLFSIGLLIGLYFGFNSKKEVKEIQENENKNELTSSSVQEAEENIVKQNVISNTNKNNDENIYSQENLKKSSEKTKETQKEESIAEEKKYNEAAKELDKPTFLTDFNNYNPGSNEIKITESQARKIAQKGFEESARRIAGEGADNVETETVKIQEISPNNYFTRTTYEGDKMYTNIKRKCYCVTRNNDMENGITIYVDATTGLIIGGRAFGD